MAGDSLRRLADYIRGQARPVDKFGHQPRLESLILAIGAGQAYDREVALAAAWLHDLGVFVGHRPDDAEQLAQWDHVAYVCSRGPAILRHAGFPEDKIPRVLDAIREHRPNDDPVSIEATLLRDADILEQLGAVGILRTVSKVGRDSRFLRFTDAVAVLRRNLNELPGKVRLDSARRMAQPRIEILRQFLRAVEDEAGSSLC